MLQRAMTAPSDASLIARVRAGEPDAFEGLVTRYKGLVFSTVARIVGDRDAAGDVAQEAFIRAYSGLGTLSDAAAFKAWLLRIAANEAFRWMKERRPELLTEEPAATAQKAWGGPPQEIDEALAGRMTARAIEAGIARLPATYRAALTLRFYGRLPYKEIADSLGITLANLKFRIHHGSRLLRGMLGRDEG